MGQNSGNVTQVGFADGQTSSLNSVADIIWNRIVNRILLPVIGGLAVLALIYAGITYITANGNAETIKKGRQMIINVVLALAILVAAYTILGFIIGVIRFAASQTN